MVARRGDVHWADFDPSKGSRPKSRRPALVVQSDTLNLSASKTVLVAPLSRNARQAAIPGHVFLPSGVAGLDDDSVVITSRLTVLNKADLDLHPVGSVPHHLMSQVDEGLRLALDV